MKVVDLQLNIAGLILDDETSIDEFVDSLKVNSIYPIVYQVLYEEKYDENEKINSRTNLRG